MMKKQKLMMLKKISTLFVVVAMVVNSLGVNILKVDAATKMSLNIKTVEYTHTNQTSKVKKTQSIQVKNLSSKYKVSWKSSNKKVATVKSGKNGKAKLTVSLGSVGRAKITATVRSKKKNKKIKTFTKQITVVNKTIGATAKPTINSTAIPTLSPTVKPTVKPTEEPRDSEKNLKDVEILTKIISDQKANGASISEDLDTPFQYSWNEETGRLEEIDWYGKELSGSLDLSGLTSLRYLRCGGNQLTSLDLSGLTSLTNLRCDDDVIVIRSKNPTEKDRGDIELLLGLIRQQKANGASVNENLDGWQYTWSGETGKLEKIIWVSIGLSENLDFSGLTSLTYLDCAENRQITSLNVSGLTSLRELKCNNNKLANLDVSGLTSLTILDCYGNKIANLDVSMLTSLRELICGANPLTSLDVSNLTVLEYLNCDDSQLTSLDVSNLIILEYLNCTSNQLTSLNVRGLTSLKYLSCGINELTSLDVNGLTSLNELWCWNNLLTSLDVSGLTSLEELHCDNNVTVIGWKG